jgi:dienelactone hydrolase
MNAYVRRFVGMASLTLFAACTTPTPPKAPETGKPLTPRAELFAKPTTSFYRLNADGTKVAWFDTSTGAQQLQLQNLACSSCGHNPLTLPDGGRPFMFFWSNSPDKMVVVYSSPAKKRLDVASYELTTQKWTSFFPEENVSSALINVSPTSFYGVPLAVFKVLDQDKRESYFRVDFARGQRVPVPLQNQVLLVEPVPGGAIGLNKGFQGGTQWVFVRANGEQIPLVTLSPEDVQHQSGFLSSYLDQQQIAHAQFLDTSTSDTLALLDINLATGQKRHVLQDKADLRSVLVAPNQPAQAAVRNYLAPEWVALAPELASDVAFLNQQPDLVSGVWSRSADDKRWLLTQQTPGGQETVALYDRARHVLQRLNLGGKPVAETGAAMQVRAAVITARDKTPLVSYLTTPAGQNCQHNDCPMVVVLHGGPRLRDEYPRTPTVAWLVDRGYAVLTVNYRGSSGFGKTYEALNIGQWGLAMQDDVLDATEWAIAAKVADPKRIAVMGASHGGFLAINSVTVAPTRFACAVAAGATANLASFVEKVTTNQPALAADLFKSVGDTRIPAVKAALLARSPISKVAAVRVPMLITHGGKDQLAPVADMDEYAKVLAAQGGKVSYVVFPEEGHGFQNQASALAYYGLAEHFLADCLGGRREPLAGSLDKGKLDARYGRQWLPAIP